MDKIIEIVSSRIEKILYEKQILMNRLEISIDKILSSFGQANAINVQMTHLQVIEDVIFANPHLITDDVQKKFFLIKNDLDANPQKLLPLSSTNRRVFEDMLEAVQKKKTWLNVRRRVLFLLGVVFLVTLYISTISTLCVNIKSNCYEFFPSQQEKKSKQVYSNPNSCASCAWRTKSAQRN